MAIYYLPFLVVQGMLCGNFCLCGKRSSGQKNALKISAFGVCCGVIISLLITTLMQLDTFHFALFLELSYHVMKILLLFAHSSWACSVIIGSDRMVIRDTQSLGSKTNQENITTFAHTQTLVALSRNNLRKRGSK